jgi:Rad3-related DNA helicase
VLVFLPSYGSLNKIKKEWRKNKVFKDMFQERDIFIEDKSQELNQKIYQDYLKAIKTRGKAALIGVCRGKLAEGIDFSDEAARAVVMAGIPYPSVFEPRVILK